MRKKEKIMWIICFIIIVIVLITIKDSYSFVTKPILKISNSTLKASNEVIITPYISQGSYMGCASLENYGSQVNLNLKYQDCKSVCAYNKLDYSNYKCVKDVLTCTCKQWK